MGQRLAWIIDEVDALDAAVTEAAHVDWADPRLSGLEHRRTALRWVLQLFEAGP